MAAEFEAFGVRYATHPDVYDPHDDTWLLLGSIDVAPGDRFLDVGCGTGVIGIHAATKGAHVVASDVNPAALALTRANARRNGVHVDVVRSDLLRGLRVEDFDAISFNPPYLPTRLEDRVPGLLNRAFDGGRSGREVVERFLGQLAAHRRPRAWFVWSSLQGPPEPSRFVPTLGLSATRVAGKHLSGEALSVFALSRATRQ